MWKATHHDTSAYAGLSGLNPPQTVATPPSASSVIALPPSLRGSKVKPRWLAKLTADICRLEFREGPQRTSVCGVYPTLRILFLLTAAMFHVSGGGHVWLCWSVAETRLCCSHSQHSRLHWNTATSPEILLRGISHFDAIPPPHTHVTHLVYIYKLLFNSLRMCDVQVENTFHVFKVNNPCLLQFHIGELPKLI